MEETVAEMPDCLFCRMVTGQIPVDMVLETDTVVAFRDINPMAATHVLVIPRAHHADVVALADSDPGLAGELLAAVGAVAQQEGLVQGFRTVFNTGADAGQSVGHVHAHVLGGRSLSWPPG
jgi:histidine triad (HIT) family protein